ncbi:MAG: hypothetical protein H6983_12450 [Ectothiorhodospiraceae bacterium]|nr:hypothetical protein [Chromatiales bacterium]MCP5154972.1 hypothetical protein [Ectothiorhodospiraceae bacterium]
MAPPGAGSPGSGPRIDPFARPLPPPPPPPEPEPVAARAEAPLGARLTATVIGGPEPLALIDGQVLGVGEAVQGHRVVEVGEGRAVLERDGRRTVLTLE